MANAQDKITSLLDIQNIQREAALALTELDKIKAAILSTPKALSEYKAAQGIQETRVATENLVTTNNKLIDSQKVLVNIKKDDIAITKQQIQAVALESTALDQSIAARERLKTSLKSYQTDQKEDLALLKAGSISQQEYRERVNLSQQKIESYKLQIQQLNKEIKNQTKEQISASDSLNGLRTKLNLLTSAYESFSNKQKVSVGGLNIKNEIIRTTQEIKNQEQEILLFQRNVGNYAEAGTNSFQKAYSGLRTLANLLPGIGISGIVLLFADGIANAAKAIFGLSDDTYKATYNLEAFKKTVEDTTATLDDYAAAYKYIAELKGLDISAAGGSFEKTIKLKNDIKELNKELDQFNKTTVTAPSGLVSVNEFLKDFDIITQGALNDFDKIRESGARIGQGFFGGTFVSQIPEEKRNELITFLNKTFDDYAKKRQSIVDEIRKKQKETDVQEIEEARELAQKKSEIQLTIFENYIKRKNGLLQDESASLKNIAQAEAQNGLQALNIREQASKLDQQILDNDLSVELRKLKVKRDATINDKKNADLRLEIEQQYQSDVLTAQSESAIKTLALQKQLIEDRLKLVAKGKKDLYDAEKEVQDKFSKENDPTKELARELAIEEKIRQQRNTVQDQAYADSVERLNTRYAKGKMSEKQYNDERDKINYDYQTKQLEGEIHFTEQMLGIMKHFGIDVTKQEGDLAKLKAALSDAQRNHRKKELEDQKKDLQDLLNEFKDYYDKLSGIISSAVDLSITKKRNQIAEEMKLNDEQEQRKIEQVKNSTLSEQEKANQIIQIQESAAVQRRKLEQEDKQAALKKAQFDKANALFHIAIDTAQAVIKDLNKPFKIAFDIALGAAQAAIVAATPLPKFERGTKNSPEGFAKLHTGETVIEPSGRSYLTPNGESIGYLPRHSVVLTKEETEKRNWSGILQRVTGQIVVNNDGKLDEIKQAVLRSGQMTASAIKRVRQTTNIYFDTGFNAHIDKQVKN